MTDADKPPAPPRPTPVVPDPRRDPTDVPPRPEGLSADPASTTEYLKAIYSQVGSIAREQSAQGVAITVMRGDVQRLNVAVFGSLPPPPLPEAPKAIATRTSLTEAEADATKGMLLAVEARTATLEDGLGKLLKSKGIATTPASEPDPTFATKLLTFVRSREALKLVVAIATLLAAAYSSLRAPPHEAPPVIVTPAEGGH